MNWVGYNSATDIELPGHGVAQTGLRFPDVSLRASPRPGQCPCLDPARFHYEITSREITI